MTLNIAQSCEQVDQGWWNWSVWLDGPSEELDNVESVTYLLHSTFPNPVREIVDRDNAFRLDARGWGEFMIRATVLFRDGATRQLSHWLVLESGDTLRADTPSGEVVYVSHAAVDTPVANAVKQVLTDDGFVVMTDTDAIAESSVQSQLVELIESADRVVGIVSDSSGPWVEWELELANKLEVPVTVVGVAGRGPLPDWAQPNIVVKQEMELEDLTAVLRGRLG
jgi:hypothetical protein